MAKWRPPDSKEFQAAALPLWREVLAGMDWLALRASPVYRGVGVPHGDGSVVVLVPGFLGSDQYMGDMFSWLRRIGYQPYMSGMGRNADCPDILTGRLMETVNSAYRETGRKVHLVGHSLGGTLVRGVASRWPNFVASVVTMASPFRAVRAHPMVLGAAMLVRQRLLSERDVRPDCYSGFCSCDFLESLMKPLSPSIVQAAIYTKTDGVVDWHCCVNDSPDTDIEVSGTHAGLAFNAEVYSHIASVLASACERSRDVADSQTA